MKFRTLRADEIDVRVAVVKENGVSLLLYKDARCDMNILDETVGPLGWKREHTRDNANCIVSIWDSEKEQWISKEDTGTESRADSDGNEKKGLASDSFKRACFNWGIGRELYTAPFIWINANDVKLTEYKGKPTTRDKFSVAEIGYTDSKITSLKIRNDSRKKIVYTYGSTSNQAEEFNMDNLNDKIKQPKANVLQNEVKRLGMTDEQFLNKYKKQSYLDFTENEWLKLVPALQKIK